MMFKYYTCELVTIDGSELKYASITCKFWFFINPCNALRGIKMKLREDGVGNHKVINLRRIK